jgi:uncharacterized protein
MDRVFLDANVLFSAAYAPDSRLLQIWALEDVELATSLLAIEEARRNLVAHRPEGVSLLDKVTSGMTVVSGARTGDLPDGIQLADKDVPILLAAIDSGFSHLLTGDKTHFGSLYGRTVGGVLVEAPAQYLRMKR